MIIIGFLGAPFGGSQKVVLCFIHKILYSLKCNILRTLKQGIIVGFLGAPFGGSQKDGYMFYHKYYRH